VLLLHKNFDTSLNHCPIYSGIASGLCPMMTEKKLNYCRSSPIDKNGLGGIEVIYSLKLFAL